MSRRSVSPGICTMTVWCRRVSVRIRLVWRSGSLSYSPCRSFSAHSWITGLDVLHADTVRESLPTCVAPGNQAHAFTSAGSSWQLYKPCSIFVYVASATGILHFENSSLSWGVVKVMAFGMASQTYAEDL